MTLLKKTLLSCCILLTSKLALAHEFTCPSVEELAHFDQGFFIEYPLSFDTQTKTPNTWIVGQVAINKKKDIVDTLIITPVRPENDETEADAAAKMIPAFQLLEGSPFIDNIRKSKLHLCVYWSPVDGSMGSYIHVEDKHATTLSPIDNMNLALTAMGHYADKR